jgi:hypothetical protein
MAAVADLHKSAFWIYGVTAMIMREPLAVGIRRTAESGIGGAGVADELLRVAAVFAVLSRFFLAEGLFFDEVHLRQGSGAQYPRRSYPLDFLFGMVQLVLAVGASTAIQAPQSFAVMIGAFLLFDNIWLAVSACMRLSTLGRIGHAARAGRLAFLICGATWAACNAAGLQHLSLTLPAILLLVLTGWETAQLVRAYEGGTASAARQ